MTHEVDWPIAHRRRAMAAAFTAVGFVGHRAVIASGSCSSATQQQSDAAGLASAAVEQLCPVLDRSVRGLIAATEEPGAQQGGRVAPENTVRDAVGRAVLMLASVHLPSESLVADGEANDGGSPMSVYGLREACRRLAWACVEGEANPAQRAIEPRLRRLLRG